MHYSKWQWADVHMTEKEGTRAGVNGQSVGKRLSFSLGRYATVFQTEIYAILVCVYEIQFQSRPEKYVSICCDSQAALNTLQAIRTASPLVQQCQKTLNDISTQYAVGLYWVPRHAGVWGNLITNELARDGCVLKFVGPEPALGVSRQYIQRRTRHWLVNQHWMWWRGLGDIQRQAQELILGPCLGAKARFVSCNRTQSRAVTGSVTGHNTLRRHLHLMGLSDSPLCRRCGVEDETLAHILCECEAFASLIHVYLGSFYLEPEDSNRASIN